MDLISIKDTRNMNYFIIGLELLGLVGLTIILGVHRIEEGHVGVYYRGGALLNEISDPGFHFFIPYITTFNMIQTTVQTDKVTNIPV